MIFVTVNNFTMFSTIVFIANLCLTGTVGALVVITVEGTGAGTKTD